VRSRASIVLLTAAALGGFAANSLLCRAALGSGSIDAASFTGARLTSGAVVLLLLSRLGAAKRNGDAPPSRGSWGSALALFLYALPFSLAYLRLHTGVGALVLFAAVQVTMIGRGLLEGERPSRFEWVGILLAFSGLALLTVPGAHAPDAIGFALMTVAGIAWGVYSLRGRGSRSPLSDTAHNFARSLLFALPVLGFLLARSSVSATPRGWLLAVASGSLASGVGYSLWYAVLPTLGATRAAALQLLVPVLAALAGVLLLGERIDPRLVLCAAMILGGVALALACRRPRRIRARSLRHR
jgi:drug/metabolite transporter (DMT)-like permease